MTSVSQQPQNPTQDSSSASQSVAPVQSSQSAGGPSSQQASASGRGNVTRQASVNNPANIVHGKSGSIPPANGKGSIPPAVPTFAGPTIVNGNNAVSPTTYSPDHNRKTSVTISASGVSGQMSSGGPASGKSVGNSIQFGSMGAPSPQTTNSTPHIAQNQASLAVSNPSNPRITSPQNSPSPIPQPPASGGRPPSSLHNQGNGMSFGSMGDDPSRQPRGGMQSGSLTPGMQPSHLRRESSQSSHNDMGNGGMGHNGGRNNYSNQGGRARGGYQQGFPQQQMPYSPNPGFRQLPPQAPRGNQGMPSPYQGQRPLATPTFQHSPHQVARSPSLANAHPIHPQNGQIPPGNQQMPQTPYGVQGYPAHLQQAQYQYPPYDPQNGGFYSPYGVPANMSMGQYMPNSPHPPYPGHPIQYVPGQYGNQAPPPMSRSASGVSDRPGPNVQPHTPMTPAPNHQPSTSRSANSPAPTNSNFKVPPKHKSAAIQIRNPNDRTVVTFEKAPKSPATVPTSKSPANVSATPTPPPQTPAFQSESQHARTDSQSLKSGGGGADVALSFKEQVQKKIEEAEQRAKVDEATKNVKAKDGEEAQPVVTEESKIESKPVEASKVEEAPPKAEPIVPTIVGDIDADSPIVKPVQEAPKEEAPKEEAPKEEAPKEDTAKEEPDQPEEEDMDSDEYWARIEAEELRKEQEQEEAYQKKKAAEREVAAKKEAEDAARQDEELKNAEREAEAAEEARTKRLESGVTDDTSDKQDLFKALKKSDHAFQATKTPPTIETPSGSGSATPVMESTATMGPPATRYGGTKQKPLPLKLETTKQVEQPQPSAALQSLRSARFLTAINDKTYPPAINSPNPALNSAAPMGKFRYDKGFLMQFQTVFVEKPSETWTEKVKETVGDTSDTPASARPGRGSGAMNARNPSNRGSVLPGTFGGGGSAFGSFTNRTLPPGTTSTQRYEASLPGGKGPPGGTLRYNPANGPSPFGGMGFGQPMSRTPSSTSMSGHPQSPRNSPSHRGSNRGSKAGKRDSDKEAKTMPLTAGLDLKPLEVAATGWKPHSVKAGTHVGPPPGGDGYLAPDIVQRKVKAALNKMTPTTFQKIADQILEIVAQSRKESDGRTLRQVIQLTFEKATDEAHWAAMYAQFCSKMLSFMTPEIKDETLPNDKNGQVISGVNLFRKYLLNRCQQDFEAGWKSKLPDKPEGESEEAVMLSDEYYTAAAAKRRGLGLVRFIGELFKLGMLTGRIMHMCVKRLVDFDGMPDEAEVESLTSLLRTIGEDLDTEGTARRGMDAYFARIQSMVDLEALPSRLRFMLMDIIDLRRKGWKGKDAAKGPATIEEVRNQAAEAERQKELQRAADNSRRPGGGRMGTGRGDARQFSSGGQFAPPADYQKNTVGMDDLRRLGRGGSRPTGQAPVSFGPTSMFNTRGSNTRKSMGPGGILARGGEESGASSRTATPPAQREKKEREEKESATHVNAFSALAALDSGEANDNPTSPPSSTSSPPVANARPNIDRSTKGDA